MRKRGQEVILGPIGPFGIFPRRASLFVRDPQLRYDSPTLRDFALQPGVEIFEIVNFLGQLVGKYAQMPVSEFRLRKRTAGTKW